MALKFIEFKATNGSQAFVDPQHVAAVHDVLPIIGGGIGSKGSDKITQSKIMLTSGDYITVEGNAAETVKKLKSE
jgi:hypothetical protein